MTIALSQFPGIYAVDGTTALRAALALNQPIAWDCPVTQVAGQDPTKSIFVPDGANITFMPGGLFTTDASGFPALSILNTRAVLTNPQIRYVGVPNIAMPHVCNTWNDGPAKAYLNKQGIASLFWTGPTNTSALISIRGTANVTITGGRCFVDAGVTADRFPTVLLEVGPCALPGSTTLALPTLIGDGFELDGSVMGYVGSAQLIQLTNITRKRYADLQGPGGVNVGGIGDWMSPPHLFYFNDSPAAPIGMIEIKDVIDNAEFCGNPVRRATGSGYMNVAKMPLPNGSFIDGLYSRCADGGIGILAGQSKTGGKIRNATFVYDSSIRSVDGKPASTTGIFWPSAAGAYAAMDIEMCVRDRAGAPSVFATPAVPGMNVNVTVCT
jgi:hypothetical protein